MTAPNHALTGALIGLSISNPAVAMPLAFLSHFACDAIPHYDLAEQDASKRIRSKKFMQEFLVGGAAACLLLVLTLAAFRPHHWLQAAICAFLAASSDLFWIPRFMHVRRTGQDSPPTNLFLRFHAWIQWRTGPRLFWVEAVWFVVFATLVGARI